MNKMLKKIGLTAVLAALVTPLAGYGLSISGVNIESRSFAPAQGEQFTLNYHIDTQANVTINIYDARDLLIKTEYREQLAAGDHQWQWDGTDQQGRPVPAEAYHYTINAKAGEQTAEYDLTDITGGESVAVNDLSWNAEQGSVDYTLPQMARVAIRVGLKNNGPLLNNIIDWVPRASGQQKEAWDGQDASGALNLKGHPALELILNAFALPRNTILVSGDKSSSGARFVQDMPWGQSPRQKKKSHRPRIHAPAQRDAMSRGDFPLEISLVGDYPQNSEGTPIVSGTVPVRINVQPEHIAQLASKRFEPVYFVDGQYIYENEVGYFPTTYRWDSRNHNPGEHYLTVNLRGYLGNFGMATLKVVIEKPQAESSAKTIAQKD
ncbi:FlgD immunoglobulin-like domain containing protein [Microbulbifer sp. TRSA001]|uniref:FlgD immunoglobulin-like domain containing protein n=1 Tax=Microbulbifer sp. TRSA001 TaxID=3243381 RepID=UPI00403A6BF0